jgi:hypothetical protein
MSGVKGRSGRKPKWGDEQIEEAAESLLDWLEADPENHVWFKSWAVENGVPPEYLSRWSAKNAVFRQAIGVAEQTQEARLVDGGLRNRWNPRICALVLQARHSGWHDRQSLTVTQETDPRTLADALRDQMPEDPTEARQWLQSVAEGRGAGAEAEAVRDAAEHQMLMLDIVEQANHVESAVVGG